MSSTPTRLVDPAVPVDLLELLNPPQAAAVSALLGPLVVVAGPGSGKTRVLTHRVAALVRTRLAFPSQVLAVTFTNKAAGEMRERLVGLLGDADVDRMWVTTFHAMCARMLRLEHAAAGLPRAFSILDTSDVRTVLRTVLADLGLPNDASDVRQYAADISRIKNGAHVEASRELLAVLPAYRAACQRLASLDFDDLLLRALELLEQDPDVLARMRHRFRFVLVDEFQDTNPVQYRMIRLLAAEHRNVCVVGDADQAIYGFRSATPEALAAFTTDWPDARTVILEENYRSTGAIVEACRSLIDVQDSPLRPALFTANPAGDPVRLVVCADDKDEASFIASEMVRRPAGATGAVLVRSNAQTRVLEEALLLSRVPYQVVGALRFYERAEVKDALSYLRLLANPADQVALTRVVSAPRRGLGPKALEQVAQLAVRPDGTVDLVAGIRIAATAKGRYAAAWASLTEVLDAARAAGTRSGPHAALEAVYSGGLHAHVKASGDGWPERLENLGELLGAARAFATVANMADPEGLVPAHLPGWEQVEAFLSTVALVSEAAAEETFDPSRGTPVQVMTAHASKGKEFDVVIVGGVEEGLFPHVRSVDAAQVAEERRLLFVACSRARTRLTLTRALLRMSFGKLAENAPSRFIADLPDTVELVARASSRRSTSTWSWQDKARHSPSRTQLSGSVSSPAVSAAAGRAPTPGPRLSAADAVPGARVTHVTFGTGVLTQVFGAGSDVTVMVLFDGGPERLLKIALAPLSLA